MSTCKGIERSFASGIINLAVTDLAPHNLEDLMTFLTYSSNRNWRELNLSHCHIQDYGLQLLHRCLHQSSITTDNLWLQNNDLSSSSDSSLCEIIISCKVKWLLISHNNAVGETPHFFSAMLTDPSCVIEKLYMQLGNHPLSRRAMQLFSLLGESKTLKELDVSCNNISEDMCGVICKALRVNNTLKHLWVYNNPISEQTSKLIVDALKDNNALNILYLPSYPKDVIENIYSLQDVVNEKRRRRGCDIVLKIVCYRYTVE